MIANFGASFWQSEALWPAGFFFPIVDVAKLLGLFDSSLRIRSWNVIQRVKLWNSEQTSKNSRSCFGDTQKPHNEQPTHNELRHEWTKHFNVICHGGDLPADSERSYLLSVMLPDCFEQRNFIIDSLFSFMLQCEAKTPHTCLAPTFAIWRLPIMLFSHHLTAV